MPGSIFAVIRLIAVKYSQVFDTSKFEKWASGNYVLPGLENCHCSFPLV